MKATIRPYISDDAAGYLIECRDDTGTIVDRIAVTDVVIDGEPWSVFMMDEAGKMRLV